jgi:glycerophosphoryl diester phosphodiesterase
MVQLEYNIGDTIGSAYISVEPWKLLTALEDRLSERLGASSGIANALISKGPKEATKDSISNIPKGQKLAMEQAKKSPKTMLVYELKKHSCDSVETNAVDASIAKLKEHGIFSPDRVMFISFSKHICKEFAAKAPGFTVQYLEKDADPDELVTYGINGIDTKYKVLLRDSVLFDAARRNNMSINTWTVNKEEDIRKAIERGVDQITTDEPELTRQLLKDMGVKERVAGK